MRRIGESGSGDWRHAMKDDHETASWAESSQDSLSRAFWSTWPGLEGGQQVARPSPARPCACALDATGGAAESAGRAGRPCRDPRAVMYRRSTTPASPHLKNAVD